MEIVNAARHTVADITTVMDKTGREHLLVVVKATYSIPDNNKTPRPKIPPQPLVTSDVFIGEAGLSAPLYEVDFVRHKPKCDVLFNAMAHAPEQKTVTELNVAVKVGAMDKKLHVVGDRRWSKKSSEGVSRRQFFTEMPLHYGRAFGGIQYYQDGDEIIPDAFEPNLVGLGYNHKSDLDEGLMLPNLEVVGKPVKGPIESYQPIALSAIARNWLPRRQYAGTYDQYWREEVFPFLPNDFDERYFQCAPEDQQIEYPQGGEDVLMLNMMKNREVVQFKLPRLDNIPLRVLTADYQVLTPPLVADTLYFEPEQGRFSVVWRASLPLKGRSNIFQTIAIGHVGKEWWEAKAVGAVSCSECKKEPSAKAIYSDNGHQ